MVEEEERLIGRPGLRLRGFRRPRPRPRFRPPSRLRPQLQDDEERELEEMMAALGEEIALVNKLEDNFLAHKFIDVAEMIGYFHTNVYIQSCHHQLSY